MDKQHEFLSVTFQLIVHPNSKIKTSDLDFIEPVFELDRKIKENESYVFVALNNFVMTPSENDSNFIGYVWGGVC
jgi:hypothetical protein